MFLKESFEKSQQMTTKTCKKADCWGKLALQTVVHLYSCNTFFCMFYTNVLFLYTIICFCTINLLVVIRRIVHLHTNVVVMMVSWSVYVFSIQILKSVTSMLTQLNFFKRYIYEK